MILLIISSVILLFIILIAYSNKKEKELKEKLKQEGFDIDKLIPFGTYVGGHPDKNDNQNNCYVIKENENASFYYRILSEAPKKLFSIKCDSIKSINVEDATSIEKRVTLGRVLLVGVFALAWRKKKKNELAFVVIDWNDERFDHSTTFSFEGSNAMQLANTSRNELIKICKEDKIDK